MGIRFLAHLPLTPFHILGHYAGAWRGRLSASTGKLRRGQTTGEYLMSTGRKHALQAHLTLPCADVAN